MLVKTGKSVLRIEDHRGQVHWFTLSGRWTFPYDSLPNRYLFSSRCDSIHTEKKRRKKSRRADCLAGRGKTIIFLFYQRVNSYTKRFLERFETGAICNSCVFSSHTFLNCLNGFLIGIVSEKLIFQFYCCHSILFLRGGGDSLLHWEVHVGVFLT